jgi:hypothetical protein
LAEPLAVGIQILAAGEFAAYSENFGFHACVFFRRLRLGLSGFEATCSSESRCFG